MTETSVNPYTPPSFEVQTERGRGCNTHRYAGRTIYVRAGYLPSRLWMLGGFTVTTDTGERFTSAQVSFNEDFHWTFDHHGTPINCHLQTARKALSHCKMPYDLTIGDDPPSHHVVRLSGAWCSLLVIPIGLLALAATPFIAKFAMWLAG